MKKIILIFMILFINTSISHGWDSTLARFYPLKVGNSYTYISLPINDDYKNSEAFYEVYKVKIIKDTILSNGKKYFVFDGWWTNDIIPNSLWKYQRIDSMTMNVYAFDILSNSDKLLDSLYAQYEDTFSCYRFNINHPWGKFHGYTVVTIFGLPKDDRNFLVAGPSLSHNTYYLTQDFGLTTYRNFEFAKGIRYSLKGCVINGVVYGDTTLTSVQQIGNTVPDRYNLHQNYPNPFNPSTNIEFSVPSNVKGQTSNLRLIIYDISGKELEILVNQNLNPGSYKIQWNALNYPSGVYFYKLETTDFKDVKRMLILK